MFIITVQIFSLCQQIFPCVRTKFPVFSLSGKSKNQIPCFPCAVATLTVIGRLGPRVVKERFWSVPIFIFPSTSSTLVQGLLLKHCVGGVC